MAGRGEDENSVLTEFDPFSPNRGQGAYRNYRTVSDADEPENHPQENYEEQFYMAAKEVLALKQQMGQLKLQLKEEQQKTNKIPSAPDKLMPTKYSGSTDWEEYLIQFSYIAALHGWTQDKQAIILLGKLEGEALSVATSDSDMSFVALFNRLKENFAPERKETFALKLRTRVQGKDETFEELARDVKKLARKAYPTSDSDTREMLMVESFINAIHNDGLREKLRDKTPHTLNEALHEIRTLAANKELEMTRRSGKVGETGKRVQQVSEKTEDSQLLQKVQKQLEELQIELEKFKNSTVKGSQKKDRERKVPQCYHCKMDGHIKKWCPFLQKGQVPIFNSQVPPPTPKQGNLQGQFLNPAPENLSKM